MQTSDTNTSNALNQNKMSLFQKINETLQWNNQYWKKLSTPLKLLYIGFYAILILTFFAIIFIGKRVDHTADIDKMQRQLQVLDSIIISQLEESYGTAPSEGDSTAKLSYLFSQLKLDSLNECLEEYRSFGLPQKWYFLLNEVNAHKGDHEILAAFSDFKSIYYQQGLKNKNVRLLSLLTTRLMKVLFFCFVGLIFIFIGVRNNEIIQRKEVEIYKVNPRLSEDLRRLGVNDLSSFSQVKSEDNSSLFLATATMVWVISHIIISVYNYYTNSYMLTALEKGHLDVWMQFINNILSTINSLFIIYYLFEIDYVAEPSWKSNPLYRTTFGDKYFIIILTIAIVAIQAALLPFAFQNILNGQAPSWMAWPDFIYSSGAVCILFLNLFSSFNERKKREYIFSIIFALSLVLFAQLDPLINRSSFGLENTIFWDIIYLLYPILLITLFLFLTDSWVDFFKGKKLLKEKQNLLMLKNAALHRLKNNLGSINRDLRPISFINKEPDEKAARMILKKVRKKVEAYLSLANVIYQEQDPEEQSSYLDIVDIHEFLTKLSASFTEMADINKFSFEVNENLKEFSNPKLVYEEAQFLGDHLLELIENAQKFTSSPDNYRVIFRAFRVGELLCIEVIDKNTRFTFEDAFKKRKYGGLSAIFKRVTKVWKGHMDCRDNENRDGNCITIIVPIKNLCKRI